MQTKLNVKLLEHTPNPEKVVAMAAKLCYSSSDVEQLYENQTPEKIEIFLNKLMEYSHQSPIEHISFTFAVEGVSRALTHQLVRHRIASYSQQSQRYVKLNQFSYIIPPAIENNPRAKEIFIDTMERDQKAYDDIVDSLMVDLIKNYCKSIGTVYPKSLLEDLLIWFKKENKGKYLQFEKQCIEDARYIFPNACETKIVFTMNARTLVNFLNHRCCNRAQWEIRILAEEILKLVKPIAPTLFKNAGPSCVRGKCGEGSMTCGKMIEMKKKYTNL